MELKAIGADEPTGGLGSIRQRCALFIAGILLLGATSGIHATAQSGPAPIVTASGSDLELSPPRLTRWVAAELSEEGRVAHYKGVCLVSLVVNDRGRPENVRVIQPLGMDLDSNAIKAAKAFRFVPAMRDGKPIPAKVTVEVHFKSA